MTRFALSRAFQVCWLICLASVLLGSIPHAHAQKTERVYLSGRGKDDAVPWKFFCTQGDKSGYWTEIPVPSCWESFGFGTAHYQKEPTNAIAEKGHYQVDFKAPRSWRDQRVFLVFEGSMTDTRVQVNGKAAGPEHQGSFYRFRYEVTDKLNYGGDNLLDVLVSKRSGNDSINRAERQGDYWLFGGIFRPVYLEVQPQVFVDRVAIDARASGDFNIDVYLMGDPTAEMTIETRILDARKRVIGQEIRATAKPNVRLSQKVNSPRLWSAETPHLHTAVVVLKNGSRVLHQHEERFGFRTVEVREGEGIYVNGRRVILQGANRHSFWPDSGRTLSEKVHRLDIQTMKEMNFNAVRMSHYPPDKRFLELCDELGLYVLDELAGWHWHYDTPTATRLVEQMVKRDVNHPCIVLWDNGNEGGWNTDVDDEFAKWDPQKRRVLHPWTTFGGINTAHYLSFDKAKAAAAGKPNYRNFDYSEQQVTTNSKAFLYMPTEFLHGLYDGGAGAGMEDYWTMMRASPYLAGGFVWALVDEGFRRSNGNLDVYRNQGPDGIVGPYREREASFYTIKELWSPIVVSLPQQTPGAALRFEVENRYSFTDLSQCELGWELRRFREPSDSRAGHRVLRKGEFAGLRAAPGQKIETTLSLPEAWREADALAVTAKDYNGMELWTWVWPLREFAPDPASRSDRGVTSVDRGEFIELSASGLQVEISKQTGQLVSIRRGKQSWPLSEGPRAAHGESKLAGIELNAAQGAVTARYDGALRSVAWRLQPDGWLRCDYQYIAEGPLDFHGVLFDYPEKSVQSKRWLGEGPYRVWKNRVRGTQLGVWENDYNNTITGWEGWVYPEFKGFFAGVRWMQWDTVDGLITFRSGDPAVYVQVLTPDFPPKDLQMKTEVSVPRAGLGLLHGIPPIGSKFSTAREHGPQGEKNQGKGVYKGSVEFYFGSLK